mgnify:CR=1 FL=1
MKKIAMMLTAVLLAACSSTELYDEQAKEKDLKAEYAENFSAAYPNVSLNQSWDYSYKNPSYSLSSTETAKTRAESYSLVKSDEYELDPNTLTWIDKNLPDRKNNHSKGKAFYMKTPGNDFTIVPVFQGRASMRWELHAVIDGNDFTVWEKCQNIWYKKSATSDWETVDSRSNDELYKNTESAAAVKANGYTFKGVPAGLEMYFYLKVTYATGNNAKMMNRQQSSLRGMMVALNDVPRPANIAEDNEVMIIGCEDLDEGSDWDMNDAVFMVYGKPEKPSTEIIEDGTPITKKTTVRYMIEDLGATDDFDFNDIVVDVTETVTSTPKYGTNNLITWTDSNPSQEAVIRHLGGTLPFKLTIGSTELEEHAGVLGSNPDEKFDVTGWDKNGHNITVQVKQSSNSTVYNNVKFPKAGEAPMIIAVESSQEWMPERQSVPASWFTVEE